MTTQQQTEAFDAFVAKMKATLLSKGDDYAEQQDRLSNFKAVAAITNTTPQLACLNLIATKVARLSTLLNSPNPPKNESIDDSILDLANYAVLLHMIQSE